VRIKIDINDPAQLERYTKNAVRAIFEDLLIRITEGVYRLAKIGASKHSRTGLMEHNLYFKVNLKQLYGEVGIDDRGMLVDWRGKKVNYAEFVHFGTRPHLIKPKRAKVLRFVKDGKFIFAKEVHHPGYKGDPFLYRALEKYKQKFLRS